MKKEFNMNKNLIKKTMTTLTVALFITSSFIPILLSNDNFHITNVKAAPNGGNNPWWNTDWLYRKEITISHSEIDEHLIAFPVMIHLTDADLINKAQDNGDDIVFTNAAQTVLSHEIELFDGNTGELIAWVNVDHLSATEDTIIYMYYNNPSSGNQEDVEGTWNEQYMMVHHMNDTTPSNIEDSTIHVNDGSKEASDEPIETTALIGQGQQFDGTNDHILISDDSSLDPTQITVEAWVYIDSYPGDYPRIFAKDDAAGQQYQLIAHSNNRIFWRIDDGSDWYGGDFDSGALSLGSWIYVVGTYDGSTLRAYANGVEQTTSYTHTGSIDNGPGQLSIGSKPDDPLNSNYLFDGMIDEIRISSISRNSSWISATYSMVNDPESFLIMGDEEEATDDPILVNIYPANNSANIEIQPKCQLEVHDQNGDDLDVYWYENNTDSWVLRQTNLSVSANSSVSWIYSQATLHSTNYW